MLVNTIDQRAVQIKKKCRLVAECCHSSAILRDTHLCHPELPLKELAACVATYRLTLIDRPQATSTFAPKPCLCLIFLSQVFLSQIFAPKIGAPEISHAAF
jgi:hypothetical protein